ncbi:MAG: GNAT family N-acetyltransferase [Bacteroidota bacterium]
MQPLDNPAWHALNSADSRFNIGDKIAGYFPADIAPFAALPDWNEAMQKYFYDHAPANRSWSVVRKEPVTLSSLWDLRFSITLHQMVCNTFLPVIIPDIDIRSLNETHVPGMLALTAITKPGPFMERTIAFGNYTGVFENDQLVAMTGERLHLDTHTEISAVCTLPEHTGKGYGALLVSLAAEKIISTGKTPFLHVVADNHRAIKMYERLGFVHRSDMQFYVFKRRVDA